MAATPNRKAEFAKFFDLFERLTNRALRKNRAQEQVSLVAAEASKPFAVPADLALPAIRNLSSIASDNRTRQQQTVHGDGQENINANSVVEESTVVEDKKEETNKFLAGSWYPFTFKMMLHKLYELEEWARKVKETLEKSRENYKSLSEVDSEKKKGSGEECQRGRTQSRPKGEVMGSNPAAVRTGLEHASIRKGTTTPKTPTKDDRKKSRDKYDEKVIKKRHIGRPRIVTAAQDCRLGGPRIYYSSAAVIEVEDVLCQGYSSEDCSIKSGVFTSMADGDNDRNDCSRLGYTKRSASAWESDGNTSCTAAHRKRVLSEADSTYPQISPRKRPYLS